VRARSIWAECRRDLPERACRAEGVEERLSRRRRKRKKGGAAPTWHSRGTRDSDLDSRIAVSGQKATQMPAGIFSLRKTVERREKKIAPVERMSVAVWRRPDDSLSLGDYSCCDAIQRKGTMLRARDSLPAARRPRRPPRLVHVQERALEGVPVPAPCSAGAEGLVCPDRLERHREAVALDDDRRVPVSCLLPARRGAGRLGRREDLVEQA
jgi:hypothetical protein